VTLAIAECEMTLGAARKVAFGLRLEERSQWPAAVILGGVPCAVSSSCARIGAAIESAGPFRTIEGPERPQ
jgi:hypothetical protein